MADVMWIKWPNDLSAQRRWKTLIRLKGKDKMEKLNKRNVRLCFDKEKISADGYTAGDPVD